ncbi:MAG: hypothetical protein ACR2M1_09005 [Gemmatimonadaceae bacterium]
MLGRRAALLAIACTAAAWTSTAALAQDSTASHAASHIVSDTAQHVTGLRSPATAAVLGAVIPGAGLAYAGQWRRGVGTYFTAVGGVGLGAMALVLDRCTFSFSGSCDPGTLWPQHALALGVIALGLGTWAYGAVDAARIVERNNARELAGRGQAFGSIGPTVIAPSEAGAPWAVGVHASW